jgi:replicative DNA helicase
LATQIAPAFGDRLLITQNTGLTCSDYEKLIDRVKSEIGIVDILIVDGLSMMGGKGTETELVNEHTRDLKKIAVKYNVCVIAIVHVTKEADPTTRDYTKYLRGSGKIYDNLDVMINMSLFRETFDDSFKKDRGYARMINKRGTGNHIGVVYSFDCKRLTMMETNETLEEYSK